MNTKQYFKKAQIDALNKLIKSNADKFRDATGVMRRIGVNGIKNLSTYSQLKKWRMGRELRLAVLDLLPEELLQHNEMWFLKLPKNGHFDEWQATANAFKCLIVPLNNSGSVTVDGETIKNKAGQGVLFDLTLPHEIKKSTLERDFIVFLFLNKG